MTNHIVTPKQTDFINVLLREREVPESVAALAARVSTTLEASIYISNLLTLPKKAPKVAVVSVRDQYLSALKGAEVSKYAVPTRYLRLAFPNLAPWMHNDLLFLEVRKGARGFIAFNRLTGAPGGFSRTRVPMADAVNLLKFIDGRHVEFGKLFSDHYKVCGRCAAELTDEESRTTGFGPTCRKIFGL